jgi:uncharacterized protein (TIGR02246 family)
MNLSSNRKPWFLNKIQSSAGTLLMRIAMLLFLISHNSLAMDSSDEAVIKGVVADYFDSLNRLDFKKFGDLFAEDADWINIKGMHWNGKTDLVKAHEILFKLIYPNGGYTYTNVTVRAVAPTVAVVVVLEFSPEGTSPDGAKLPAGQDELSFVVLKQNDKWKITHGHNTVIDLKAQKHDPINSGWKGGTSSQSH